VAPVLHEHLVDIAHVSTEPCHDSEPHIVHRNDPRDRQRKIKDAAVDSHGAAEKPIPAESGERVPFKAIPCRHEGLEKDSPLTVDYFDIGDHGFAVRIRLELTHEGIAFAGKPHVILITEENYVVLGRP
jgi:hypothetical protein